MFVASLTLVAAVSVAIQQPAQPGTGPFQVEWADDQTVTIVDLGSVAREGGQGAVVSFTVRMDPLAGTAAIMTKRSHIFDCASGVDESEMVWAYDASGRRLNFIPVGKEILSPAITQDPSTPGAFNLACHGTALTGARNGDYHALVQAWRAGSLRP